MENGAVFQKSVWRSIFSLCVPALVSIVVMMLYNMADMYFVGWMDDYAQVAAVSLAGPVFSVLMGISTTIGNGGCTKIAQALGAGDMERVRSYSALCVWGSIVSGTVFAVVCAIFCDPLLRLLGANAEMWEYTKSYVLIMALGAPVVLLNHSLGGALRGEGEITAGLVGGMVSTVSNIILDPVFILVLKLGVGGAAAATVLGNAIALGYYLIYKARSRGRCIIELRPRYARDLRALGAILALGLPNAISSVLSGFAGTFSNRLLVGYGTQAVSGHGRRRESFHGCDHGADGGVHGCPTPAGLLLRRAGLATAEGNRPKDAGADGSAGRGTDSGTLAGPWLAHRAVYQGPGRGGPGGASVLLFAVDGAVHRCLLLLHQSPPGLRKRRRGLRRLSAAAGPAAHSAAVSDERPVSDGGAGAGSHGCGRYLHPGRGSIGVEALRKIGQECAKKRTEK